MSSALRTMREFLGVISSDEFTTGEAIRSYVSSIDECQFNALVCCVSADGTAVERAVIGEVCGDREGRAGNTGHGRTHAGVAKLANISMVSSGGDHWSRPRE